MTCIHGSSPQIKLNLHAQSHNGFGHPMLQFCHRTFHLRPTASPWCTMKTQSLRETAVEAEIQSKMVNLERQVESALKLKRLRELMHESNEKLGAGHTISLMISSRCANSMTKNDKPYEARRLWNIVLEESKKELENNRPSIIEAMHSLALVHRDLGHNSESAKLFEQAIESAVDHYGDEHICTANIMAHYAKVLKETEEFDRAENLLRKVLDIRNRKLGGEHLADGTR